MTDDLTPLQARISTMVGVEKRLNDHRLTDMKAEKARRGVEIQKENVNLAALEQEKKHQMGENAANARRSQEMLQREGNAVDASSKIRGDYIKEIQRRKAAEEQLKAEITTLEAELRRIEAARP